MCEVDQRGVMIGTAGPAAKLQVAVDSTYSNGNSSAIFASSSTTPSKTIYMGYDSAIDAGYIAAGQIGTGYKNLSINPQGGNVRIGTTAPTQALDVIGKVASTNLRQVVSATNEVTTTSTTAVDIPSMSITINGSGLPVTMIANLSGIYFAAASYALYISLVVDGTQASLCVISAAAAGNKNSCSLTAMQTLSAGSHTIKLQWYLQSAGTAGVSWGFANRSILVFE